MVLLPQKYDASKPCPIIYTFSPSGGGMVNAHKPASEVTPSIIIGVTGVKNHAHATESLGEVYAVLWDTLARFNIDPTAQYAAGLSGGAEFSYDVARQYKEQIGGVIASGGWLGLKYDPWYVYPKGLLVARSNGISDKGANGWCAQDMARLNKSGCVVKDWNHPGGHSMAPPENIKLMMQWLIANKPFDETADQAQEKAAKWNESPYSSASITEMLSVVKTSPRTKLCNLAMLELFKIMKDDDQFCRVSFPLFVSGPELTGFFGHTACGAALAKDARRFHSAVYALDKVCQDKGSKWGGIIGALYLFVPSQEIADPKRGLAFVQMYTKSTNASLYNQLVLAAGLLKTGRKTEAQSIANELKGKPVDHTLKPVIDNLTKALMEGEAALDAPIWLDKFE